MGLLGGLGVLMSRYLAQVVGLNWITRDLLDDLMDNPGREYEMKLEGDVYEVQYIQCVESRWYTRLTAFSLRIQNIFPENAWNAAVAKSPICHRSRVWAGYLGGFGQRRFVGCPSTPPQDVDITQARNKLSDLIW